mmetsp:Transcript_36409/g.102849  ORF Transcript_36409/g.102849 Transcript_36409/m.102849 type:complete len:299 (+) Transcript_36409:187-1083(+)
MGFENTISRADLLINKYAGEQYTSQDKNTKFANNKDFDFVYTKLNQVLADLVKIDEELSGLTQVPPAREAKLNAELKRDKKQLVDDLKLLGGLIKKGERVTTTVIKARQQKFEDLKKAVLELPDDVRGGNDKSINPRHAETIREHENPKSFHPPIYIQQKDTSRLNNAGTEQTIAFRQEWELAKRRQDERLDALEEDLENAVELAGTIQQGIQHNTMLMEIVEERVENNASALDSQNRRLKGAVERMSSPCKCCLYATLVVILIATGGYAWYHFGLVLATTAFEATSTPTPTPMPPVP